MGAPGQAGQGLSWALLDCGECLAPAFGMNPNRPVVLPCSPGQGGGCAVTKPTGQQ